MEQLSFSSKDEVDMYISDIERDLTEGNPIRYLELVNYLCSLSLTGLNVLEFQKIDIISGNLDYLKGLIYYHELFGTVNIDERFVLSKESFDMATEKYSKRKN